MSEKRGVVTKFIYLADLVVVQVEYRETATQMNIFLIKMSLITLLPLLLTMCSTPFSEQ